MAKSELLTLSEVSKRTGISMPTLQRYKKEYQARIPHEGQGRKQRYPESALGVFEEIKKENIARRGRPSKKKASGGAKKARRRATGSKRKKAAASKSSGSGDLLTLTEVAKRTGISYPTLSRYVKQHGDKIPHEGKGRKRRYHPQAVEVFNELRGQSGRGRKAGGRKKTAGGRGRRAASGGGDAALSRRVQALENAVRDLTKAVRKPIRVTLDRR